MRTNRWSWSLALAVVLLLTTAATTIAQEETGNIYVQVTDTAGETLPGVNVEMTGGGAPKLGITNASGETRFLGLAPGNYSLRASLDGFSTVEYPNVVVSVARNTTIVVQLSAAIGEVITVTSESPLLDERKLAAGTTVSQVELEKIPTARDPWSLLNQAAGVMVDRINVGGNESGQQSTFRGQGNSDDENDFLVDGVQITDMSAIGSSPTYYDFDQFQEMQLATGGTDVTKNTAGVSVNLVTKRGTNEFRGSARFLLTDGDGYFGFLEQADSGFSSSDLGPGQPEFEPNHIDRIQDLGFEAGGPAWRDRVWLWASWGQNDINNVAAGGVNDRTILENTAIKLNAQFTAANSFVGSFNNGDKVKYGRGANPSWDVSATRNQRGPTGVTKVEDTHVFGSNLFLTGQYSFIDGGFSLTAVGGAGSDIPPIPAAGGERNTDENGFRTNNSSGGNSRPTEEYRLEGSYFFTTSSLNHELKFGGRTREATTSSSWYYPGRNIWHYHGVPAGVQDPAFLESIGLPGSQASNAHAVYAYRQDPAPITTNYDSLWVQDTMTMNAWTFNAGLRWDDQGGKNGAATVNANPAFPNEMPGLDFTGNDGGGLNWTSIAPRLGVTYALGEERKTLIRGSFSQFADAMSLGNISRVNPVSGQGLALAFIDRPGGFSAFYDEGEQYATMYGFWGFNVNDPGALNTSAVNDSSMDPPTTSELIIGAEHAFLPEFVASLQVTYRNKDSEDFQRLFENIDTGEITTIPASEYIEGPVATGIRPDGTPYAVQTYGADPDKWSYTGGTLFTNGDRELNYLGTSLTFTKRLSNQWMLRGFVNYNFDESWDVPSSYFNNNDPNRVQPDNATGSTIDGEAYVIQSTGSGKTDNWMASTWQWNLNGMYQVAPDRPWGFNVAANLAGREGYPIPYFHNVSGPDGISRSIQIANEITDFRNDDIFTTDIRLEKEFRTTGNLGLTFSIDGFNIFNEGFVLQRFDNINAGNAEWVREVLSPRVWRLGVRLNWR